MNQVTIYHNPQCTKSRQTLELLREKGFEPQVVEYLKTPPTVSELKEILKKLGMLAVEIIRTQEPEYKELGLLNSRMSEDGLIQVMAKHPKLIERPIVVNGKRAAIGRPPENILAIL